MNLTAKAFIAGSMALLLAACEDSAKLPEKAAFGPNPTLPEPTETTVPTINIARAKGWPQGASPTPSAGLSVQAFASGLDHPRWLYVLPNGDVLVAETNTPQRPEDDRGVKGWISQIEQDRAGAGVQSANRITLLRDADGDGVAEMRTVFLQGLNSPFGMALVGHDLYVANKSAASLSVHSSVAATLVSSNSSSALSRKAIPGRNLIPSRLPPAARESLDNSASST